MTRRILGKAREPGSADRLKIVQNLVLSDSTISLFRSKLPFSSLSNVGYIFGETPEDDIEY